MGEEHHNKDRAPGEGSPGGEEGAERMSGSEAAALLPRVLEVTRAVALEFGGPRAVQAVGPQASLLRDIGLGSLEQVELRLRLESAFGVELPDDTLGLDTPAQLSVALRDARAASPAPLPEVVAPPEGAGIQRAEGAETLYQALHAWAEAEAIRPHVYLRGDDGTFSTISYGQLRDQAGAIAAGMERRGVKRGDTVALMLPTGTDFLASFMGVLAAGAIPVPLYPPFRAAGLEDYLQRQAGILENARARLLVTTPEVMPVVRLLRTSPGSRLALTTAGELGSDGGGVPEPAGNGDDAALIQYTSGSTGAPKGVLLSNRALVSNIRATGDHLGMGPGDVGVSWLPLYHDMGLIGTWLNCLYHGVPLVLLSPLAFLSRPDLWLWTIHRYRATLSAAPNFGYELCARRIPQERLDGLDLSTWRVALNGAEPVSADTLERFARRFGPLGFRPEAMMPAYGLAESAVALCLGPVDRPPVVDPVSRRSFEREGRAEPAPRGEASLLRFVSVGSPLPGHEVRVVDDEGDPVPEGRVGRLHFRGPSSMEGYYHRPEETRAILSDGGWIDTGDLGYVKGGELYVTGRRKDLIIKAGRNVVPEDVESVVAGVEGIRRGCVAAFGVADPEAGTERLVIVAETRATEPAELRSIEGRVVDRLAELLDLPPDRVVLLPPRSVPKTSSGKIRRSETREWFQEGRLGAPERPSTRVRLRLAQAAVGRRLASARSRTGRWVHAAYLALVLPVFALLAVLPAWGAVRILPGRRPAVALQGRLLRAILRVARIRTSVSGVEHLPQQGPFLLVSNHTSYLDTAVLLGHLPLDVRIVAKEEVLGWPLVGTFVRKVGHPTVDRRDVRRSVEDRRKVAGRLKEGEAILFFPEGTFIRAAGLGPFRLGAFETAVESGVPVVPVALQGARRILPAGAALPRAGSVGIWIGPPMAPEGKGTEAAIRLRTRVFDAIAEHCGEPKLETVVGGLPPGS